MQNTAPHTNSSTVFNRTVRAAAPASRSAVRVAPQAGPGHRLRLIAAVLAAAFAFIFLGMTQASAHDALEKSSPADGDTLTKTTDTIVLTFNNDVAAVGGKIRVAAENGDVVDGDLTADGKNATYTFDAPLANDSYTVTWRVVSSDSHPIEGTYGFTVNDPDNVSTTATDDPSETASAPATDPTSESASPTEDTATSTESTTTADDSTKDSSGGINWGRVGIFGFLGALAGTAIVIFNNKRKLHK